jgi:DNA-binding transcriptional regulator YiaG
MTNQDEALLMAWVRSISATGEGRTIRKQAHLSIPDVAKVCGVYPVTVSRWELGQRRPRGEAARRYAHLLTSLQKVSA